jgi:oligoribonuclease NrnB/cAMP/cGMP phosphodiesterase (DHH superfamily)
MYNYVIFHRGCLDGFTSFIILHMSGKIKDDAKIFPDVPSTTNIPQGIEGKHIIIMDVAYKNDVLKEIIHLAASVVFIDHHVTIHDEVDLIDKSKTTKIIYDENECGASLTWQFLHPNKDLPLFVKYIRDNDLGLWKKKHTHAFIAALNIKHDTNLSDSNISRWMKLMNEHVVKKLISRGKIYQEYIDNMLDVNSRRYSMEKFPSEVIYEEYTEYFKKPGQYKVAVVCGGGCPSTSLLGLKMMNVVDCDFVIFWNLHMDRKEYVLSFRSSHVDVGNIAKIFNGGGHKLASAGSFSVNKYSITDLFYPQSLPRQNKKRKHH